MERLEICCWMFTALRTDVDDNELLQYCLKNCEGKNKNCSRYLPVSYEPIELNILTIQYDRRKDANQNN